MRLPFLDQIAIATYRHGADDADDEGCAAIGGVNAGESGLGSLRVAPGGLSDVQLDNIDTRSPIAGLYVRLERLLAKQVRERAVRLCRMSRIRMRHTVMQVWDAHIEACKTSSGARPAETERVEQWRRLRGLLAQAALTACSTRGAGRRCIDSAAACAE